MKTRKNFLSIRWLMRALLLGAALFLSAANVQGALLSARGHEYVAYEKMMASWREIAPKILCLQDAQYIRMLEAFVARHIPMDLVRLVIPYLFRELEAQASVALPVYGPSGDKIGDAPAQSMNLPLMFFDVRRPEILISVGMIRLGVECVSEIQRSKQIIELLENGKVIKSITISSPDVARVPLQNLIKYVLRVRAK